MRLKINELKQNISVWCGGVEINDFLDIPLEKAEKLALELKEQGFDDVYIEIKEG